ncbi:MAG: ABC transporter permease subunit [Methanomassiliicoccales archaeon]|nr:ABC transporter permease subunit [Methanomassiliicoccales archaeon]
MRQEPVFRNKLLPYLLVLPQVILAIIWFIWPSVEAFYQSFYRSDPLGIRRIFVGFEQYVRLFSDVSFLSTLRVTVIFSAVVTIFSMGIGLFLAIMAERQICGKWFFRTLLIIPYGIAPAIAAVLWRFLLAPGIGMVARFVTHNLKLYWDYRLNETQAMLFVIIVAIWARISYNFIFYSAALQGIPKSVVEAAYIDGGSRWKTFWFIIFPLLSPTSFFLLVVNSVYSLFETFGIIDTLTHGGPSGATEILVYRIYRDGMVNLNVNKAAAQAVLLLIFSVILSVLQFKVIERKVHYA